MFGLFKKKLKELHIADFQVGQIYKMYVAERSHVSVPYHVEIIEVGEDFIVTNIPDYHSAKIEQNSKWENWSYHIPRMEYIGEKKDFGHLLLNQKGLIK